LELYFMSNRPGGYGSWDMYVSKRATTNDPWGDPVNLGPTVNSPTNDAMPRLSPDGLLMFFGSFRAGGYGDYDIWMTRRTNRSAPWQPPVNLGPIVNGPGRDFLPFVAPDGSALHFIRWDGNIGTLSIAPILPVVDFNADEAVDLADLVLLIDNWGTAATLYDIGPYAWGDGVVDIEDLKVFVAEWEKVDPVDLQDGP
jgi:hypothetical protein